jgi:predicted ferric reductase
VGDEGRNTARNERTVSTSGLPFADGTGTPVLPYPRQATFHLLNDILKVLVTLGDDAFAYSPGQYVRLIVGNGLARDYSIASTPGSRELEFHVRKLPDGLVSAFIHERLWIGDKVIVEGPFGEAHLRPLHTGPILAIGTARASP